MDVFKELNISIDDAKKLQSDSVDFQNFCNQVCQLCEGKRELLDEVATLLNIDTDIIINATSNKKSPIKSRLNKRNNYKEETTLCDEEMVSLLLKVKTLDDLVSAFTKYNITRDMLNSITGYLINRYPKGYVKKIDKVQKLFESYDSYQEELSKKKKKIADDISYQKLRKSALIFADKVLLSNDIYSIDEISIKEEIDKRLFLKYLKILKDEMVGDISVYDQISAKILENRKKYFSDKYKKLIDKVLKIIDKPIKVGENYRLFDLLDVITYFDTDLPEIIEAVPIIYDNNEKKANIANKIAILEKIINYYHFEILKSFERKQSYSTTPDEAQKQIYKTILGSEIVSPYTDDFDSKVITHIEKEDILRLMKKNTIPISILYFNLALKRYNDSKLELITQDNIDIYINNLKKENI